MATNWHIAGMLVSKTVLVLEDKICWHWPHTLLRNYYIASVLSELVLIASHYFETFVNYIWVCYYSPYSPLIWTWPGLQDVWPWPLTCYPQIYRWKIVKRKPLLMLMLKNKVTRYIHSAFIMLNVIIPQQRCRYLNYRSSWVDSHRPHASMCESRQCFNSPNKSPLRSFKELFQI